MLPHTVGREEVVASPVYGTFTPLLSEEKEEHRSTYDEVTRRCGGVCRC